MFAAFQWAPPQEYIMWYVECINEEVGNERVNEILNLSAFQLVHELIERSLYVQLACGRASIISTHRLTKYYLVKSMADQEIVPLKVRDRFKNSYKPP